MSSSLHAAVEASNTTATTPNLTDIQNNHSFDDKFYESLSSPLKIAIFSLAIGAFLLLIGLGRIMSSESRYLLNMSRKLASERVNKYEEDKTPTENKTSKLKSTTGTTTVTETTGKNKAEPDRSVKINLKRTAPSVISNKKDNTDTTTPSSIDI